MKLPVGLSRRTLLFTGGALAGGGAGFVATPRAGVVPALLRPPGARAEVEFLAACIRCGQCVSACPDDAVRFTGIAAGVHLAAHGTPRIVPREVPCSLCPEYERLQCVAACPTDALRPLADRRDARMGTAWILEERCFAYQGVVCRACWHACPYPGEALALDARLRPVVRAEACTGCGMCEHACLTDEPSVVVAPPGRRPTALPTPEAVR
ncbi:MAG: 4Fe-4S dicluster domain-containing protein [Planctomycetes bacterium]|nr:4Fe-4S dicluster domain-containing protein [Planctomycetota bacterium]